MVHTSDSIIDQLRHVLENPSLRPVLGRDFTRDCICVKVREFRQKMETKVMKNVKVLINPLIL